MNPSMHINIIANRSSSLQDMNDINDDRSSCRVASCVLYTRTKHVDTSSAHRYTSYIYIHVMDDDSHVMMRWMMIVMS